MSVEALYFDKKDLAQMRKDNAMKDMRKENLNMQKHRSAAKPRSHHRSKNLTIPSAAAAQEGGVECLDDHDPNYDSEDDADGNDLLVGMTQHDVSGGEPSTKIVELLQSYKKRIEVIIQEHYLKALEVSAAEIVHNHLDECNNKFEEQLRELLAAEGDSPSASSPSNAASSAMPMTLPYYEVIKRAIVSSFDHSTAGSRMEAISVLLVELCVTPNRSGVEYRKWMNQGFDKIFEIINELNKDIPTVNTLLSHYLARCIFDEIVAPSYVARLLQKCDSDSASTEDVSSGDLDDPSVQIAKYRNETMMHMRDVMHKTKALLSQSHNSTKLQNIWGVCDSDASSSASTITTTQGLKQRIDYILSEFIYGCSGSGSGQGSNASSPRAPVNSAASAATAAASPAAATSASGGNCDTGNYLPPSESSLMEVYSSLKELDSSVLNFYAHEIVKRGVSMVLLNYHSQKNQNAVTPGSVFSKTEATAARDFESDSVQFVHSNHSALHLCYNITILFYFLICGEDDEASNFVSTGSPTTTTGKTFSAVDTAALPTAASLRTLYPNLPPPIISKNQFFKGLYRFFEVVEADGKFVPATTPELRLNTLFYDVSLDAPYAHYLFHYILLLSRAPASAPAAGNGKAIPGGFNVLPDRTPDDTTSFPALVGLLSQFHKK